jgi:1-acyl-sn-glycerol-3-phosphate acyltransferase
VLNGDALGIVTGRYAAGVKAETAIPPPDALPVRREATAWFRLARLVLTPLLHTIFHIRISGREWIPRQGPFVVIANHLNWPDPFLILATFPTEPRIHFLANPENLVKNRVHWAIIRAVGGYVPVDMHHQAGPELFAHVNRALQLGAAVAMFPEAAYGPREGELQGTWKSGFAHFADDNGAPVIPVAISGTHDLWLRKTLTVIVGEPISVDGRSVEEVARLGREKLAALLPPYTEPKGAKLLRHRLTRLLY